MNWKNYLLLCLSVIAVVALTVMYVPGVADTIEGGLLLFLSTNAQ
jgi:hypothetical protein